MNKVSRIFLAALLAQSQIFFGLPAWALPQGEQVISGSAQFERPDDVTMNITTGDQSIIEYNSFDIGQPETVNFFQPSSSSIALNRITGGNPTSILGRLNATGKIFLINPNGILFGVGSQIDTAGFVASVLDIDNDDFLSGDYKFAMSPGSENARVINHGLIKVASGGFAGLVGPRVENNGVVIADQGRIILAAGEKVTLDFDGNGLINFVLEGDLETALASNTGTLQARGGEVLLTARAAESVIDSVVNNEGLMDASSVVEEGGIIRLVSAGGGITANRGTLDASSAQGKGGTVHMLGDKVGLFDGEVNASGAAGGGTVLIGGDYQGKNTDIRNASQVYMSETAMIQADALESGNGGRVILWSDRGTQVYGRVDARGGGQGGDGGFIETSSAQWLDVTVAPDVSAALGIGGEWLLDPNNLEIVAGGGNTNINAGTPFVTTNDSAQLGVDLIIAGLANGDVTISTGTGGGSSQLGNITWNASMDFNTIGTNKTLTLNAHNDITMNGTISQTGNDDYLNIIFNADSDSNGGGAVVINNTIATGGGFLTFQDGVYLAQNLNTSSAVDGQAGGNITFQGQVIVARTGGITLTTTGSGAGADGNIDFQSTVNSGNSYSLINETHTWTNARTDAASGAGGGTGDTYLATVTSALENSIVTTTAAGQAGWLGGSDTAVEGTWRWVTGPEGLENSGAGRHFWTGTSGGSAAGGAYANWSAGEPNDFGGNEDALQLGFGVQGRWNDLPHNSNTLNYYVLETNLADTALTILADTGTVTFGGAVGGSKTLGALNLDSAGNVNINAAMNTSGNITITNSGTLTTAAAGDLTTSGAFTQNGTGTAVLAGDITTGGNINFNRPVLVSTDVTFYGGDNVNVNNNITRTAGGSSILTLRANNGVFFQSGADLTASNGSLNLIVNADRDANEIGNIKLDSGTVLTTNGGEVILSGGNGDTDYLRNTGYAWGTSFGATLNRGVYMTNAQILSGAGNITIRGHGDDLNSTVNQGVDIIAGSIVESSSGNILINGIAGNGSAQNDQKGVVIYLGSRVSTTTSGNINITGTANNSGTGTEQAGVQIVDNAVVRADDTGSITITGIGGTSGAGLINPGVWVTLNSRVEGGNNGAINLNGTPGSGNFGILFNSTSTIGEGALAGTYSGNIALTSDRMGLGGAPIQTTGTATILAATADTLIDVGSTFDTTANTLEIAGAEIQQFTVGHLVIGGGTNGNIRVQNITAANSNNVSGTVTLNATRDNARIIFDTTASTFNALTANADDGIDVDVAVTTDTGAMTFNGDFDNAADTFDNIDLAAVLLTSAGAMSLTAATGGILLSGINSSNTTLDANGDALLTLGALTDTNNPNLTVNSEGGITLSTVTLGTGTHTFTVDNDNDGTGTLTLDGIVQAGALTLSGGGTGTNDTIDINADVTAASTLTIQNAAVVDLAAGVDLTTSNGALTASSNVGSINLSGADATTNIIDGNGDASVNLATITDTNNVNLTLNSEGGLILAGATNLGTGAYVFSVDNDDDGAGVTLQVNGAVTGSSNLTLRGGTGSEEIIDLNADITARLITIRNVASIDLAEGVDLNSTNGVINLATSVQALNLSGADGSTNLIDSNGDAAVTLAPLTDTNNPNLTVNSEGGISFSTITLGTGTHTFTMDSDDDNTSTMLFTGIVQGGALTFQGGGTGTNDTIDINEDVTAASTLTIQNANLVDLAAGVDVTASNGALTASSNVGSINLSGADATTNIIDGNGDAAVSLAALTDTNNVNLTVNAEGNLTLTTVTLGTGTHAFTADNDNDGTAALTLNGVVQAGALTLSGGGTGTNDTIDINADVTAASTLTIQNAATVDVGDSVDLTASNGAFSANSNVGGINLSGASSSSNYFRSMGDALLNLGALTDTNNVNLITYSDGGIALAGASSLGTGEHWFFTDADNDGSGTITVNGAFTGNGALRFSQGTDTGAGDIADINADLTGDLITFDRLSLVDLGANVDLTANSIDMNTSIGSLNLSGADGSANIIDVNGDNHFTLPTITDTNNPNLTVNAEGSLTLGTVTLGTGIHTFTADNDNDGTSILTLNGAVQAGALTLSGGGTGTNDTLDVNASISSASLSAQNFAAIDLGAGVTTTASQTYAGPITLSAAAALSGVGLTFNSTINGAFGLTLNAGAGDLLISGVLGGLTALASLDFDGANITLGDIGDADTVGVSGSADINAMTDITFNGTTYKTNAASYTAGTDFNVDGASASTFTTTDDAISFTTGTLRLTNGSNLIVTSGGGAITAGAIRGTSSEDVTLTSSGGTTNTVSVGVIGEANEINTVALTGSSGVTLNGNIITSDAAGNTVTVTGPAVLGTGVVIDSNNTTHDGQVSFSSTINGAQALNIDSGGANLMISGVIGGLTALTSLVLGGADITVNDIGDADTVGVSGVTSVAGNDVNLTGTTYKTNEAHYAASGGFNINMNVGATTTFTTTDDLVSFEIADIRLSDGTNMVVNSGGGAITVEGAIRGTSSEDVTLNSNGGTANTVTVGAIGSGDEINTVALTGSGGVTLNGNITTSDAAGNTVTVAGPVILGADVAIDTNNAANDGIISFSSTINGARSLTLDAGSTDVAFPSGIGTATPLTGLTIDASNWTLNGAGAFIAGNVDIDAASNINFNFGLTTTAGGTVTLSPGGTLFIADGAAFNLDGAFLQDGAGGVRLLENVTTTNDHVEFQGAVTLEAAVTVSTGAGAGNITLGSTINGAQTLALNAGTGILNVAGNIGALTGLTGLSVAQSGGASFSGSLTAQTVTLTDTTGTVTFAGPVTIGTALVTAAQDYAVSLLAGGTVAGDTTFLNTGGVTLGNAAGDSITFSGGLDTTAGTTSLGGSVITTNTQIDFGTLSLNANALINSGAGAGNINLNGAINGAFDLQVIGGIGDVTFSGVTGGTTPINTLTLSGDDVNINAEITTTGDITITNEGLLTTAAAGDIVSGGNFTNDGDGSAVLSGDLQASGTITLDNDMTLPGNFTVIANGSLSDIFLQDSITKSSGALASVSLTAERDIVISNPLTDTSGNGFNLSLTAGRDILLSGPSGDISNNGTYTVDADSDNNGTGSYSQNHAGSVVDTTNHAISVTAASIDLAGVLNSGTASAALTAKTGSILESSAAETANIIAGALTLDAVTGIGTATEAGDLDITVSSLDAAVSGIGGIFIHETNAVTLNPVTTVDGAISVTAGGTLTATSVTAGGTSRHISLTATVGNILAGSVIALADTVTLIAAGAVNGVTNDNTADISAGTIHLTASSGGIGTTTVVDAAAGAVINADTTADNGNIELDSIGDALVGLVTTGSTSAGTILFRSTGAINSATNNGVADFVARTITLMASAGGIGTIRAVDFTAGGATINADTTADNSSILLDSIGNAVVGLINAGSGDVTLNATGAIDSAVNDNTADIIGGTVTLNAQAGGIGTNRTLDVTETEALFADTTADNGGIVIDGIGDMLIGYINAGSGNITVNTAGAMDDHAIDKVLDFQGTQVVLTAPNGVGNNRELELLVQNSTTTTTGNYTATETSSGTANVNAGGDILDDSDSGETDFSTSGDTTLDAGGVIGTQENPIEVIVKGQLFIAAGGKRGIISAMINGTTSDGKIHLLEDPEGLVLFNNRIVGGQNSEMYNDQIGTASGPTLRGTEGILRVNDVMVEPSTAPIKIDTGAGSKNIGTTENGNGNRPQPDVFNLFTEAELTELLGTLQNYFGEN